ncbi:MAG: bifunctional demethylmenaquinone methyltransferase/2-methoxy-6-polyprenyl-1,4-benzoquinol methylase UbiE [Saprospiraceae bacterium]|nr:bifunctional demethylmenaquinone methyltransferase/2-methoxy-6-polyprenyl-1,4-benzoquinol methylase UbiE [Saprospiraceae bacterium]
MQDITKVTPYDSTEESKKGQVTRMFDRIAPYYDLLNRVLSAGIDVWWRKKAIDMLKNAAPKTILDVATGTSDLAIEAARKLKPDHITAMDISVKMLDIGRNKVEKAGLGNVISLETGDSEAMRYDDNNFDAVMAAFGVRNFENLEKGLKEMYRVTRPGGMVMILEFSKPVAFPVKQLFHLYFKFVLPVIGRLKSKDRKAYRYLYESVQAFPDYRNFADILERCGYKNATYKALTGGICTIYTAIK